MGKPVSVKSCEHLAQYFIKNLNCKVENYDEIHLVFDHYDIKTSLKTKTHQQHQVGRVPVAFQVTDTTHIAHVPFKTFLSHVNTKDELNVFLAHKVITHFKYSKKVIVATAHQEVLSNHLNLEYLRSSHEEADTKLILHGLDATK